MLDTNEDNLQCLYCGSKQIEKRLGKTMKYQFQEKNLKKMRYMWNKMF